MLHADINKSGNLFTTFMCAKKSELSYVVETLARCRCLEHSVKMCHLST